MVVTRLQHATWFREIRDGPMTGDGGRGEIQGRTPPEEDDAFFRLMDEFHRIRMGMDFDPDEDRRLAICLSWLARNYPLCRVMDVLANVYECLLKSLPEGTIHSRVLTAWCLGIRDFAGEVREVTSEIEARYGPRFDYREYLATHEWKARREFALDAAGHRCQVCNSTDRLNVHHRTYERIFCELPDDLFVLCDRCHRIFHAHGRLAKP